MNQGRVEPRMVLALAAVFLLACEDMGTVDVPGPVRAFDPVAALPKVQAFAGAGAQLVSFKANHVLSNGTIDLEASYHSGAPVEYVFLRPSGAVEDPTVPVGARSKPDPFVRVSVTVSKPRYYSVRGDRGGYIKRRNRGMEASRWGSASQADAVPLPACGLDRLWQEARRLGAPADAVATVTYDKYGFAFEIPGTPTNLKFDPKCQVKKPEAKMAETGAAAALSPTQSQWTKGYSWPIGVDSDGDGAEDLLGLTTRVGDTQSFVSLFDGKTFAERYRVGPFGSRELANHLFIAAAGKRFVVLDPTGNAHLFELADGKLVTDFTTSEGWLCGPPAAQTVVAATGAKKPFIINTVTGVGKIGALPTWCQKPEVYRRRLSESWGDGYVTMKNAPQADYLKSSTWRRVPVPPNTSLVWGMADGNDAVALGCIAESEDCQLLGFDVSGKLRYARPAAPYGLQRHHDGYCDLAFGRMICQRYVDQGTAVFAVDVASGEIRWSTTVAAGKGGVLGRPGITPTRVWVPWHDNERHNSVYAIDAVTGALLGAAGM